MDDPGRRRIESGFLRSFGPGVLGRCSCTGHLSVAASKGYDLVTLSRPHTPKGGRYEARAHRVDRLGDRRVCRGTESGASAGQGLRTLQVGGVDLARIDAFDRQRTLFILPVGMIEQHGPHLPVGADTIGVVYEANEAATRVSRALPQWNVVMMPALNYGHSGANHLGDMPIHPGTYAIRQSTLRSLLADLGAQIAQNGFKWIFVINGHGAPTHNIAINEACDFVSESYGVTMLHLTGLFRADSAIQKAGEQIAADTFLSLRSLLVRYGCACWRRRDIRHPRDPTRSRPSNVHDARQPGGVVPGGIAEDCNRTRLAGLSVVPCQGERGVWPGGRGMVDRRFHGPDAPRRARRELVRPCARARYGAGGRRPHARQGPGDTKPHSVRGWRTGWCNAVSVETAGCLHGMHECYDVGHLHPLGALRERNLVTSPVLRAADPRRAVASGRPCCLKRRRCSRF